MGLTFFQKVYIIKQYKLFGIEYIIRIFYDIDSDVIKNIITDYIENPYIIRESKINK